MELKYQLFLEALTAYFRNEKVNWDFEISMDDWRDLFALAEVHKVHPLVFEAVYDCPAIQQIDEKFLDAMKRRGISVMMLQVRRTNNFLQLCEYLQEKSLRPIVVKGIVCRRLYPNPDLRVSADEDLWVEEPLFGEFVEALQSYGLQTQNTSTNFEEADEIGFLGEKGLMYIELHKHLFSKDSDAYGNLNDYFEEGFEKAVPLKIHGTTVYTLNVQMHLFYLICHSLKHFLHSGFGIRQVCDIALFANAYGKEVDWLKLLGRCREIHAEKFTAAVFKIAKKYLNFDEEKACYPKEWKEIEVDEEDLLMDLLHSGIYGSSSMSRKHSSNMTLEAVAAYKKGKKVGTGLKASLFPSAKKLEGQYTYLKKQPYLLPVAWGERVVKYCKETVKVEDNNAIDAMKIGSQRILLLEKYGILEK